jgi:hypothetical protein
MPAATPGRKEGHRDDGNVSSPGICDHRPRRHSSHLAPQQKMGLLPHRRHQRDYLDSPVPLLDRPFVKQTTFTLGTNRH